MKGDRHSLSKTTSIQVFTTKERHKRINFWQNGKKILELDEKETKTLTDREFFYLLLCEIKKRGTNEEYGSFISNIRKETRAKFKKNKKILCAAAS